MDKMDIILIVLGVILLGFIIKVIDLKNVLKRDEFTRNYRDKFIILVDSILKDKNFNKLLYYELTLDVKAMQSELGNDGVYFHMTDNLKGYSGNNYQLLINFLPELKNSVYEMENEIFRNRLIQSIGDSDDMFIRHFGTLNELKKSIFKELKNPFSCFSEGMKTINALPIFILNWFGFLSDNNTMKLRNSWIIKGINLILIIISLISAIITIVLGWDEFQQIITNIFDLLQRK
jgi:hypothetical protein